MAKKGVELLFFSQGSHCEVIVRSAVDVKTCNANTEKGENEIILLLSGDA